MDRTGHSQLATDTVVVAGSDIRGSSDGSPYLMGAAGVNHQQGSSPNPKGCPESGREALVVAIGVRHRISRWGATDVEVTCALAGDESVAGPGIASTRAIDIHAPAHVVWPWLVQMGWKRAGWYSYDMIDNGRTPSAEKIIPTLQSLHVGDLVPEGPEVGWTVSALEPDHLLLLDTHGPMKGVDWVQRRDSSWLFLLTGIDAEHTRLLERSRTTLTMNHATLVGRLLATRLLASLVLAPGDFVMARRHMLGIKRRAERDWCRSGVATGRPA